MNPKTRIIVFDLGGVLVRICGTLKEAGVRCGIELRPEELARGAAERRRLQAAYELGRMGGNRFFEAAAATFDGRLTPAQYRTLHEAVIIEEYAGVSRLIDDVHAAGLTTGVLSNTNHAHWSLQASADRFPAIAKAVHKHASHLLGVAKPSEKIYREFERRTGFASESIVFFDDLPANVKAAREAGWDAHQVWPAGDVAAQMRAVLTAPLPHNLCTPGTGCGGNGGMMATI